MLNSIRRLLGLGPQMDLGELIRNGAMVIDVRSPAEYAAGHGKGSINIPLDSLKKRIPALKKDVAVITCCASGLRSKVAKSILKSNGIKEVYNGGSWHKLKQYEI